MNKSEKEENNKIIKMNEIGNKINNEDKIIKHRSYTFGTKNLNINKNNPIYLGNQNLIGNIAMRSNMYLIDKNERKNDNKKCDFLDVNKLPKIISRLSLSNFHKKMNNNNFINNNEKDIKESTINNSMGIIHKNKFNVFNKTSGLSGFQGIAFNKGISGPGLRNTNFNFNNQKTNINKYKLLNSYNEKYSFKNSNENISNNLNNSNNIYYFDNNSNNNNSFNNMINSYNYSKEKKKFHLNKNLFNTKAMIHNTKYYNNNINNMLLLQNNNKKEKNEIIRENIMKNNIENENEEKNNLCDENNDSFMNELNVLISNDKSNVINNIKNNNDSWQFFKNNDDNNKNNDSDEEKEPDPRINFEQINRVNQSRPETSYGGLKVRRNNLRSAMQNKNKNRPCTSNKNL